MTGVPLATAFVRVRASTDSFRRDLERGVDKAGVDKIGDRAGRDFGGGFSRGLSSTLGSAFTRAMGQARSSASAAAAAAARDFAGKLQNEVADGLAAAAREGTKASRAIDEAGNEMSQSARAAAVLDREIDKLSGSLREMAISQALTGENFGKQIREQEAQIRRLARNRKLFGDVGEQGGLTAAAGFATKLNPALSKVHLDPIDVNADPKSAFAAIAETERKLRALAGDATTVELKVHTEQALGELRRFKKLLGDSGTEAGVGFAAKFSQVIAKMPIGAPVAAFGAGVAVAAAPLIGATISAAVIGGAGAGGVIGGVLLASRDERVKAAGTALGQVLLQDLEIRAQRQFVDPMLSSIRDVQRGFNAMDDDLDRIFANGSRLLRPLTNGAIAFVQRITTGVADLTDAAGPVIDVLSQGIGDLGNEIANLFTSLKDNGVDAATALHVVFTLVNTTIRATGIAINALTESFGFLAKIGAFGQDAQLEYIRLEANAKIAAAANRDVSTSFLSVHDQAKTAASGMGAMVTQALRLAGPVGASALAADAHARAMRGELGAMTELNTVTRSMIDPLFAFTEAQKKVKTAQDLASEAVRKHGRNSTEAREATRNLATAALDLQARSGALAQGFNGKLTPSMRQTFEAAGLTKRQIRDVEGQLVSAKKAADKYDGKYNANVSLTGANSVKASLRDLLIQQNALKKGISVSASASAFRKNEFHAGGWTGPGSKYRPAGTVHADEFVIQKSARQKIEAQVPGLLDRMNATGQIPGYAAGGQVWPFPTTAAMTHIMSRAEALSKVAPLLGAWPSSPSAQRGDSGVWRKILALVNSSGIPHHLVSGYRRGDRLWHGSGRADDFGGFDQDRLARFFLQHQGQILEMIHRTSTRDYAYARGKNQGSFNESLMNAHRDHLHIAMAGGGLVPRIPVFDAGGVLSPGFNLVDNRTGRYEHVVPATGGGDIHIHIHDSVITSRQAALDLFVDAYHRAKNERRIP